MRHSKKAHGEHGNGALSWDALVVGLILSVALEEATHDLRKQSNLDEVNDWISYQEKIQMGDQRFEWKTRPESMGEAVTELKLNHMMRLVVKSVKKLKRSTSLVASPKTIDSGSKMNRGQMKPIVSTVR